MRNIRIEWLDSLKGLGILFVVLGHCFPPQQGLTNYLYSFHIALFFFISGYFIPNEPYRERFTDFWQKRFKRLMLPYFIYGIFTYIVWLVIGRNFGVNKQLNVEPLKPLIGLFYGNGFDNYLVFNIAIWFLPALFSTLLLYYLLWKAVKNKIGVAVGVLVILSIGYLDSIYGTIRLPWGINISFIAIFFVYLGHQSKHILEKIWIYTKNMDLVLAALLLWVGYLFQILNSGVSFNSHSYGNILYFLISAGSSILGYAILTKILLDNRMFQFLGINSLRILALHILSFSIISAIIKYVFSADFSSFKVSLGGRITYFIGSIVIVSIYAIIVDRVFLNRNKPKE